MLTYFFKSLWYIILADYYLKYPWIFQQAAIACKDVISALKLHFSEFSIPQEVLSSNGLQFTVRKYQEFAAKYGFKLTTGIHYYPKGHEFIERQVQTIKNVLSKYAKDGFLSSLVGAEVNSTWQKDTITWYVAAVRAGENNPTCHYQTSHQ